MKTLAVNILLLLFVLNSFGQDETARTKGYKPVNLEDAVAQLKFLHPDSVQTKIQMAKEDEFTGNAHMGMGMWMRNNWGLWKGKELADYFNSIGIYHPDDMSGIILTSYHRELNGLDWAVAEQVKYYQEYWASANEHFEKLETDSAYKQEVEARRDSIEHARYSEALANRKNEFVEGARVSGYLEYQCRLFNGGMRTKVMGTVVRWDGDVFELKIDGYKEPNKKKRVIKCNEIVTDKLLVTRPTQFKLIED